MSLYKSKTAATWLALGLGAFGLHRLYVHGLKDKLAWLHPWPTLVGVYGIQRMDQLGQDDRLAWVLMPILGLMLSYAMLNGIIYGLTPDERWDAQHNPGQAGRQTGWGAVIGVIACLMIGGAVLMTTIAFSAQRYFESQVEAAQSISQ
ncbi:hypothetical protein [Pelomonas sp. SE-A7]|uniref:hypothetical protein n=1 Tax=Pelomonas sp. SE-A7 TaxID=3054953 RepID=UPI00259D0DD6|nr:hypothetical protein [Pelomonas sp. SE-A7]MDM4764691.1 hypothetical protein [Pelomonas sp. SE-A7]